MQPNEIQALLQAQREYFQSGETFPVAFRINALKKLYACIRRREGEILSALHADLGKSSFEGYMCEVGMALSEISHSIKKVKAWSKPRRAKTPLAQFAAKSYTMPSPRGNTLVISPWNYPFLLSIDPLAQSIAAGNTVILKPSA